MEPNSSGIVTNYHREFFEKYQYLIKNYDKKLIFFNNLTERKLAVIIINLIKKDCLWYILKFNKLKLIDKLYLLLYYLKSILISKNM